MIQSQVKIAVFGIHRPFRAPNERYRWFQFQKFLNENNIRTDYFYILDEYDDKILFNSKNHLLKIFIYIQSFIKRWQQIKNLKNNYHTVLIYRELHWFSVFTKLFLKILKNKTRQIVFDFDDAIWLPSDSFIYNIIKQPQTKTVLYLQFADKVIAGNSHLAHFAEQYNTNVQIIPTVVDTKYYIPLHHLRNHNTVTIGWMGSHSTIQHLKIIFPVLKKIKEKYPFVQFKFVAKKQYIPELNIYIEDWNKENEIQTLNTFDIGIMPLPNDEWSKGKCGLKLLTYMACEIPCVASNVGANSEIIHKTNGGLLCNNQTDWLHNLSLLIENPKFRKQLGSQGRKNVEKYYSLNAWKQCFFNTLFSS